MEMFWMLLVLVIVVIVGNLLILLRSAKLPRVPPSVRPQPYRDDED